MSPVSPPSLGMPNGYRELLEEFAALERQDRAFACATSHDALSRFFVRRELPSDVQQSIWSFVFAGLWAIPRDWWLWMCWENGESNTCHITDLGLPPLVLPVDIDDEDDYPNPSAWDSPVHSWDPR